mgnify:CR=1 FL=1
MGTGVGGALPDRGFGVEQAAFDGFDQRPFALWCAGRQAHRLDIGERCGDHRVHAGAAALGLRERGGQLGVPGDVLLRQALRAGMG